VDFVDFYIIMLGLVGIVCSFGVIVLTLGVLWYYMRKWKEEFDLDKGRFDV